MISGWADTDDEAASAATVGRMEGASFRQGRHSHDPLMLACHRGRMQYFAVCGKAALGGLPVLKAAAGRAVVLFVKLDADEPAA